MNPEAAGLWDRAQTTLRTAARLIDDDPDSAASRAYYAAFYAVSAFFALGGRSFRKHSELEAAVHRDLVKTGAWSVESGNLYSWLGRLRTTGDYGGSIRVSADDARRAVEAA
jgi:uncharacterized protein (UPF0332 family)